MKKVVNYTDINCFILGFLPYFIDVIVADLYKGGGIINIYYVLIFFLCISAIPNCLKNRIAPVELILYIVLIIIVEFINRQTIIYYYEGLLQIGATIILSYYLIVIRRLKYFLRGLISSIVLGCVYFCMFSTNSGLNIGDSELRHSLPFFYISAAGLMTSLGYFFALVNLSEKYNLGWMMVAGLCLSTCLYTLSKSAILSIIVITIIYLMFVGVFRLNRKIIYAILIFCGGILGFAEKLDPIIELFSESIDNSNTEMINVSGRSGIWLFCVDKIQDHLWLGHGYYSACELLMDGINENVSQAHNGILHALLATGRVGFALLTIYVIRVFYTLKKKSSKISTNVYMRWILCMMIYFMIRSITEASFTQCRGTDVFWFFLLSLVLMHYIANVNLKLIRSNK